MSDAEITEALEEWTAWEREHDLFAPDNIRAARDRNFESPGYREDLERRYAASRTWKELEEALEVAEAVDRAEAGETVDFKEHFDYTSGNQFYDEGSLSDEEQLRDEYGFELADVALFLLKTSTTVQKTTENGRVYKPDFEEVADWPEESDSREIDSFRDATASLYEKFGPESEDSDFYSKVMNEDADTDEILRQTDEILGDLSSIATELPKRSLSDYVAEKIRYNTEERSIDDMDADHPDPEKEFKRNYEK